MSEVDLGMPRSQISPVHTRCQSRLLDLLKLSLNVLIGCDR